MHKFLLYHYDMWTFYNPRLSFSRTWLPSLLKGIIKENGIPLFKSVWRGGNLTSISADDKAQMADFDAEDL